MKRFVSVVLFSVTVALSAQQADVDLFREAESRFEAGDYELALDRYRTLTSLHPVSQFIPDAQFRIAIALYRTDRALDALAQLDRVSRRFRSTRYLGLVPFWQGVIHYNLGEYPDAVERLEEFGDGGVSERDARSEGLLYLALSRLELGQTDDAERSLVELISLQDRPWGRPYPFSLLLSIYARAGRGEEILTLTEGYSPGAVDPEWRARIRLYQGEGFLAVGMIDPAVEAYREVERASAELATLAFQRLFVLAEQRLIDDAPDDVLRRAEQALAGRIDVLGQFWLRVGVRSFEEGRGERAELYLRRVWDLRTSQPIPAAVALYLSRILQERGELETARAIVSEYLGLYGEGHDDAASLLLALGNLDLRLGRPEAAVATLRAAYERVGAGQSADHSVFPELSYQLGFALREVGQPAEALVVVERVFASGRVGGLQPELVRLRSRLLREVGRPVDALQALSEYVRLRPTDAAAAQEYVNLLYSLDRFDRVIDEVPAIDSELVRRQAMTPSVRSTLSYVLGLALLNRGRYADASGAFDVVLATIESGDATVREIAPSAIFYSGWAAYRAGDYAAAARTFERLYSTYPQHVQSPEAAYLAGWSHFRRADYAAAQRALARVGALGGPTSLQIEARFVSARALAAQSQLQQAASAFRSIYLDHPQSDYADDAWFEYAEVQSRLGSVDQAADAFDSLVSRYPDSSLAEAALMRRGDVLLGADRFAPARDAFFDYRTRFPNGSQIDAALYWGGEASVGLGEEAGALLLWERLISQFRQSAYRAEAMRLSAAILEARSEFRQALNLYTEFRGAYPEEAAAARVQTRIDELVLLISGLGEREARLLVTIENERGAATERGRDAILELGRLVIASDAGTGTSAANLLPRLEEVAERRGVDPIAASQALFLMGEYSAQRGEHLLAANRYIEAATIGAIDRELAARSIYRAAVMFSTMGRAAEVDQLLARLRSEFPGSEWLEEARSLRPGDSQ